MTEIKLTIPEGCKTVTIKVDGEKVTTEFETKEKWTPKDGDFIAFGIDLNDLAVGIFHRFSTLETHEDYATISEHRISFNEGLWVTNNLRPATEEEKQRLFDALAKEGKRWNAEKKRVEDLPRWRANCRKKYFFIDENTDVQTATEGHFICDDNLYIVSNYFKTEEAAERVAEQVREIFRKSKAE